MTVLPFPGAGWPTAAGDDDLMVCACGSTWFELYVLDGAGERVHGAVVLNRAGDVTGYNGIPHCLDCGSEQLG